MCAVESGNISLVVNCLNAQMQPFVKDALNRDAMDYANHFQNVQGHNMQTLIAQAIKSWRDGYSAEEFQGILDEQQSYDENYFTPFRSVVVKQKDRPA